MSVRPFVAPGFQEAGLEGASASPHEGAARRGDRRRPRPDIHVAALSDRFKLVLSTRMLSTWQPTPGRCVSAPPPCESTLFKSRRISVSAENQTSTEQGRAQSMESPAVVRRTAMSETTLDSLPESTF